MNQDEKNYSCFSQLHPVVSAVYFLLTLSLTMFSNRPVFLFTSLAIALSYTGFLRGIKSLKSYIPIGFAIILITTVVNGLFTHNGATVLFYIKGNRVTLEALAYGLTMSLMFFGIIVWFSAFSQIMTSDKIIYLFSSFAPVLGLVISMVFRFIPLLKDRYGEISMGQQCIVGDKKMGKITKITFFLKKISTLISWSLEGSIESADSMSARGYGLKGRTSFHLFKWEREDVIGLVFTLFLGVVSLVLFLLGYGNMYFYPVIKIRNLEGINLLAYISFLLVITWPLAIDLYGEYRWRKLKSTI